MVRIQTAAVAASLVIICVAFNSEASRLPPAAQQPPGKIMGIVVDPNGAVVVRARVKVENAGIMRKVRSRGEGEFEVELPAGFYRITVEADGFRRYRSRPLEVKPNETKKVEVRLKVAEPRGPTPASAAEMRVEGRQ